MIAGLRLDSGAVGEAAHLLIEPAITTHTLVCVCVCVCVCVVMAVVMQHGAPPGHASLSTNPFNARTHFVQYSPPRWRVAVEIVTMISVELRSTFLLVCQRVYNVLAEIVVLTDKCL